MSKVSLVESTSTLAPTTGGRWKVVLAVPGKGMKGNYLEETLRRDGPAAFPAKTRSYIGHAAPQNRDPRDQLGTYPDGAYYEDGVGLVAELKPRPGYKSLLEELGEDAELSIYADGEKDDDDNVTAIYPGRANSVDLVAYGGLEGSGLKEKLYESYTKPDGTPQDKKEGSMDKEIVDALAALKNSIDTAFAGGAPKADTRTTAEIDAEVESKVKDQVATTVDAALTTFETQMKAVDAADLLPSQVESLRAEARKGVDITPLIESAKAVVADAKKTLLSESYSEKLAKGDGSSNLTENWGTIGMKV